MDARKVHILSLRDTDVQGAINRCCGSEELYSACLKDFLTDETIGLLNTAIIKRNWDDAFTAAHALKGLAGNMGFIPLMHSISQLVILIRGGRINDIGSSLNEVKSCYRDIIDAIQQFLSIEN